MTQRPTQSIDVLQVQSLQAGSIEAVEIRQDGVTLAPSPAIVDIATADANTLNSAPVELIPSPGPGRAIMVLGGMISSNVVHEFSNAGQSRFVYGDDASGPQPGNVNLHLNLIGERIIAVYVSDDLGSTLLSDVADTGLYFALGSDDDTLGQILTTQLHDAGTGYAADDNVSMSSQHWIIDTVDGGGAVLTYHAVAPPDPDPEHAVATDVPVDTNTGVGTGMTLDILTIQKGEGSMRVFVDYRIVELA